MKNATILVIDDEPDILELIRYNLAKEGYHVECEETGGKAVRRAQSLLPNLMILDLMLPGIDGLEVCRRLKSDPKTAQIAIIMLTAKSEDADVVSGLELGADDYVTKPFSPRVLLARVRAVLRRKQAPAEDAATIIKRGDLSIDAARHIATVKQESIDLTALEMKILQALARRPGLVLTRYQIVKAAQGEGVGVTDRSVDVHMVSLRRKLGECGNMIETVRGVGYRFKEI